jgi:hypothetical protein
LCDLEEGEADKPMSVASALSEGQPRVLELQMNVGSEYNELSIAGEEAFDGVALGGADDVPIAPPAEMVHEAALRSGINTILDETSSDEDELACIREICQQTLATMDQVTAAKSLAHRHGLNVNGAEFQDEGDELVHAKTTVAFAPPKSPQERLLAFMPNAMEKSKARMSRRPSYDR